MPRRYRRMRLGTRHPLPVSLPQLLLRQLMLLAAAALACAHIPTKLRHATEEAILPAVRIFLVRR